MSRERGRAFCLTGHYDEVGAAGVVDVERKQALIEALNVIGAEYFCYGEEISPETGRHHLQAYVRFSNARSVLVVRKKLPGFHVVVAKGNAKQNILYCSKTREEDEVANEVFIEFGSRPVDPEVARERGNESEKRKWSEAIELAVAGKVEDIEPELQMKYYTSLKRIQRDRMIRPEDLDGVCGFWLYGPTRSGKSHRAREMAASGFYSKLPNKWWDGYQNEDFVLIEDFDKCHHVLGYHMKIWADKYAFTAEIKGTTSFLRPRCIIVTSNYHPQEIWDNAKTLDPILERFRLIRFEGRYSGVALQAPEEVVTNNLQSENQPLVLNNAVYVPGFVVPPVVLPPAVIALSIPPTPIQEDQDVDFLPDIPEDSLAWLFS